MKNGSRFFNGLMAFTAIMGVIVSFIALIIAIEANKLAERSIEMAKEANNISSKHFQSDLKVDVDLKNIQLVGCTDGVEYYLFYKVLADYVIENKGGMASSITKVEMWGSKSPIEPGSWHIYNTFPGDTIKLVGRYDEVYLPYTIEPGNIVIVEVGGKRFIGHWGGESGLEAATSDYERWRISDFILLDWYVYFGTSGQINGRKIVNREEISDLVFFSNLCSDFEKSEFQAEIK
jgi:hypothetical protein